MLGFIKGKLISKHEDTLQGIVLAHRVGYEISFPKNLFERLTVGEIVGIWLHTHVREDALTLFGFASEAEKYFFRILLGVSGLGPKTAMSLLTEHGADKLFRLILNKDADAISEAQGVGKKLAQRLVLDLSGKVEKLALIQMAATKEPLAAKSAEVLSPKRQLREDLSSALLHLGYAPNQIKGTLDKMFDKDDIEKAGFESCLKGALKEMSGRLPASESFHA